MANRIKDLLKTSKVIRVFGMGQLCSPKLIEIVGMQGGYDAVWLDQEHAGLSIAQIEQATLAARAVRIDTFVRLTATDYGSVMQPLEAGTDGIMAAQVRSAVEAEQIVRWAKFQPRGLRGVNGTGVDGRYGSVPMLEYMKLANANTFISIQIEHIDALNEVEKIAAIPDVDFLFIGPADLGQSMGLAGQWDHPEMWKAIERVANACKAKGVPWAILPRDAVYARRCVELGCRLLSVGFDVWAFQRGLKTYHSEYEGIG